ncbi:hypothetical protein RJO15_24325 [Herbaspirillum huttiense F1]|uniref:hypothetical protein n=1 Tax=Herbaspirillum huttiense TaxID=863372 RepID=UPI0028868A58|nr:hypothetical protein [Herbaspirillum huttiense]MDT0358936.1 hypothetical protein [Herbaspirillum huttiense F1]
MENDPPNESTLQERVDDLELLITHLQDALTVMSAKLAVQGYAISALLRSQPENQKFSELLTKVVAFLLSGERTSPGPDYEYYVTEQLNAFLDAAKGIRPAN